MTIFFSDNAKQSSKRLLKNDISADPSPKQQVTTELVVVSCNYLQEVPLKLEIQHKTFFI